MADTTPQAPATMPPNEERPASNRGPGGHFAPGNALGRKWAPNNTERLKHGGRSRLMQAGLLPGQQAIGALLAEEAAVVIEELGGAEQVSTLKAAMIRDWLKLGVYQAALEDVLEQGGMLTGKGRTRAAATVYLAVLTQRHRVAEKIGLSRVPKAVASLEDVVAALARRKANDEPPPSNPPTSAAIPKETN